MLGSFDTSVLPNTRKDGPGVMYALKMPKRTRQKEKAKNDRIIGVFIFIYSV